MGSFSTKETEMKEESPMQAYESLFSEYPDVLTVHQVRSALGIGRAGVYKLLESRQIKAHSGKTLVHSCIFTAFRV